MDGKIEYSSTTDNYIFTTESASQVSVSVSSHKDILFHSPPLEIKDFNVGNAPLSSKDENSVLTSTPKFRGSNHEECQSYDDTHEEEGKNLRVRRKECHRVHYTSDLDDSNLTYYEGKKRNKKRMTLLQSLSSDNMDNEELYLDTLENHLFPDMSFSDSELSYSESKFNTSKKSDSSWSKLKGVSYSSKFDFSGDELDTNRSINHAKRSNFRQKRRDWYLNRRNVQKKSYNTSPWWRSIRQFFQILFIVSIRMRKVSRKTSRSLYVIYYGISKSSYKIVRYVSRPLLSIFQLYLHFYTLIKTKIISVYSKVLSLFVSSSVKENIIAEDTIAEKIIDEKEKTRFSCCTHIFCWILLLFAISLAVFAGYYDAEGNLPNVNVPIPNPMKSGIDNAYAIYIDVENSKIPAWHIYPELPSSSVIHPIKKSLKDLSPVILYLRHVGAVDTHQLKSVYKTLSSLGYHIVVPTNKLDQYEVLKTWKWIKTQTNSTAYMWGYGMSAATLTVNAKLFCKNKIPPNGVVIAREIKNGILHQSMEMWSCNCALTTSGNSNGTDFKYNHVKCPIAFSNNDANDVYSQVVACIETVNKSVK